MTEPSEAAKAWAAEYYSPFSPNAAAMIGFDAGRASAPLPVKVLEAVREYEKQLDDYEHHRGDNLTRGNIELHKDYIADAVLTVVREGR